MNNKELLKIVKLTAEEYDFIMNFRELSDIEKTRIINKIDREVRKADSIKHNFEK